MWYHGYRIIEIEWAVKNDKAFVPSPKRSKKSKGKKKSKAKKNHPSADEDVDGDKEEGAGLSDLQETAAEFGAELTNIGSPSKIKRPLADTGERDEVTTPPKRLKRTTRAKTAIIESSDEEWDPPLLLAADQVVDS